MRLLWVAVGIALVLSAGASAARRSAPPPPLRWAPPTLVAPTTVTVPDSDGHVLMDPSKDYVVKIGHLTACGGLWLEGGHNVVVMGGEVTIPAPCASAYDRTAIKVRWNTGTVHLEGILVDGPYTHDGIVTASPQTILQVENVRIEGVQAMDDAHPDCLQTQAGLAQLRVDRFTCRTQLQGFFLKVEGGNRVGPCDIRNVNLTGAPGKHLFFQTSADIPVTLTNAWLYSEKPWAGFGYLVYPQADGRTFLGDYNRNRRAIVSRDRKRLWFVGSNIHGVIRRGPPPNGDLVPAGVAGIGYSSPGYASSPGGKSSKVVTRRSSGGEQ